MKRYLAFFFALIMLVSTCKPGAARANGDTITLVVWSFTNELEGMIEKYYAPNHPEIDFEFQLYPTDGNNYESRLDRTLGVPEVAVSEFPRKR